MCLIFLSYHQNQQFPLIVAANRDEFYSRPSEPIHQWQDNKNIIAGRDIEKGGSWLGISLDGRFAAVTNFRSGQNIENKKSRGELILNLLSSDKPDVFIHSELSASLREYNDFNCLFYHQHQLYYLSNKNKVFASRLKPGVYGLSNALLDTPWPKLKKGKTDFSRALQNISDRKAFWTLLSDDQPARDQDLPDTGVSPTWEKLLSSRFIRSDVYGTRSSTLLYWSVDGEVQLMERRFDNNGFIDEQEISVQITEN